MPSPDQRLSEVKLALAAQLLLIGALLVDAYLGWVSLTGSPVAGCGPASNCQAVLSSRWAYWFGIPVSLLALLVNAGLLAASRFTLPGHEPEAQLKAWQIIVPGSLAVLGSVMWFVALQAFVLKKICPFCMTAHACAGLAAVLLIWCAPIRQAPPRSKQRSQPVSVPPDLAAKLSLAAMTAVALLIAGQLGHNPGTYTTDRVAARVATNAMPTAVRQFQLFDGQFRFDLDKVPLTGPMHAPHVMVSLFDYTCHHCREMHAPIMEAQRRFSNQLAVINLPMPLDAKCNPIVKRTLSPHTNACALAKLGLTVWRANSSAAPKFDDWIFTPPNPPLPDAATEFARQLVGTNAFDRAVTNQWIDEQIRQDVALYDAVYRRFKKGFMPQVIIGSNLISGTFTREQLAQMLAEQFGLGAAPAPKASHAASQ